MLRSVPATRRTRPNPMAEAPTKLRLFLALYPPPEIARAMPDLVRGVSRGKARRTPVDQIHMTVVFLGDRPEREVEKITLEARSIATATGPIRLAPERIVSMPEHAPPRLVALECAASKNLQSLYSRLVAALTNPDEPVRPRLLPHFTLCRFRRGSAAKPIQASVSMPPFEVCELCLIKSTLSPDGAEHTRLATVPLAS